MLTILALGFIERYCFNWQYHRSPETLNSVSLHYPPQLWESTHLCKLGKIRTTESFSQQGVLLHAMQ